jgi:hypothetical protein
MDKLFAINIEKQEVIVSESPTGSQNIMEVERVARKDNELLYQAVKTLTMVSNAPMFNVKLFKAMDKVCQLIYLNETTKM